MKKTWYPNKKSFFSFEILIMIFVFIILIVWCNIAFNDIRRSTSAEQLQEATETINKSIVLCYSVEGIFPPNLQYLKDNYGLTIDESRYIIYYNAYAPHIMPEVILLNK